MFAKFIVILVLILIVGSLASALIFLLRNRGDKRSTVRALTWRIGLSIALFAGLMVAGQLGIIQPHGLRSGIAPLPGKTAQQ